MKGFYYCDGEEQIVVVPYVFLVSCSENNLKISLSPDSLERIIIAIRNNREGIAEKLKFGIDDWASFDVGDRYLREITNHCFKGRLEKAGELVSNLALEIITHYGVEARKNGH